MRIYLDGSARKVYQRCRRRFGMERSYRQLGRLPARITSRNPALRFLLLGFGLLLLNSWVCLRWAVTPVVHRFIAFLRRAIEQALGAIDSIPGYS